MSRITYADISARRVPSGAWELTAIVRGYLEHQQYYGYSKRDALRMFHEYANRLAA